MTLATLAMRNVLRNKVRGALTVAGVAVAVASFLLLRTIVWAWTAQTSDAPMERIVTRDKVTFIMSLPRRYADEVRVMPGVKLVTWASWFGGRDRKREHEFFATLAVDPATFLDVHDEVAVAESELKAWKGDRQGALVGFTLARRFGWKVGDTVRLTSEIYPGDYELRVSGLYTTRRRSFDPGQLLFHWDYMNDSLLAVRGGDRRRDQIGWIVTRVADPRSTVATAAAIDRHFDERESPTLSQDEQSFQKSFLAMFSAILTALDVVTMVILGIMMLIIGNTVAMGVRERTHEHGVLRAIGFQPRHVAVLVVGEAATLGLAGSVLGLGIAIPLVNHGMGVYIEENFGQFFPFFRVTEEASVLALALGVALAGLASGIPALLASRLSVVDALRRTA